MSQDRYIFGGDYVYIIGGDPDYDTVYRLYTPSIFEIRSILDKSYNQGLTISQLFDGYKGDYTPSEINYGDDVGEELWYDI